MGDRGEIPRYLENWQDEVDSATEYRAMAAGEPDPRLAKVYANLAEMEEGHIPFWEDRLRKAGASAPPRRPSWRSRVLGGIARRFGPDLVLATIAAKEEVNQNVYVKQPETASTRMSAQERWHAKVLRQLDPSSTRWPREDSTPWPSSKRLWPRIWIASTTSRERQEMIVVS